MPLYDSKYPASGLCVLKLDQPTKIIRNPKPSLKEIQVQLDGLNNSKTISQCALYLKISQQEWMAGPI